MVSAGAPSRPLLGRHALGLDVGGTYIKWVLLDCHVVVVDSGHVPTPRTGPDDVASALAQIARRVEVDSVGIGVPGLAHRETGVVRFIPNIPGEWGAYPLAARVAQQCGRPVALLNDARAFGLAELRVGSAKGLADVVFVTLGTGIGGALAIDGKMLVGRFDGCGEFGHQTYDVNGPMCGCGNRGCVETYSSGSAIVRAASPGVTQRLSPALLTATGSDLDELTPLVVAGAAAAGDPFAAGVIGGAARALASVVASTCALFGAEAIVVGGGVSAALPLLRPYMEEALTARRQLIGDCVLLPAGLGEQSGAMGAALWGAAMVGSNEHEG